LTDAVGSLSRTYDERGNLLSEKRVNGTTTFTTGYGYDQASRLASITYPSGEVVQYTYDGAGRIVGATAGKTDATSSTVVSGMGYLPFGPDNALTFGNGIAEARNFDADYRMTGIADTGTAAAVIQKLTYGFDAANNVHSITDGVSAANSQTLGYDVLNRLTSATGSYGTLGYSYDANGNRMKQTLGSVTTTYAYTAASNILASYTTGSTKTTVATNANGNITSIPPANSIAPATFAYNVANRLSSVVGSPTGATFLYDAFGQRFSKADAGYKPTTYIYGPGGTLLEENDNGAVTDYLYANGRPIGTYVPATGKVYFIQTDHLGTPQLVYERRSKNGPQSAV
jgi:YD repeat-containing protein